MDEQHRVLVVEDEIITALFIKTGLTNAGYLVTEICSSAEKAIISVQNNRPDVILMDIDLSGDMTGIEAAGLIRESLYIPTIILTGYFDSSFRLEMHDFKPDAFVVKPVDIPGLLQILSGILDGASRP